MDRPNHRREHPLLEALQPLHHRPTPPPPLVLRLQFRRRRRALPYTHFHLLLLLLWRRRRGRGQQARVGRGEEGRRREGRGVCVGVVVALVKVVLGVHGAPARVDPQEDHHDADLLGGLVYGSHIFVESVIYNIYTDSA